MGFRLMDGTGKSFAAKISSDNALLTTAVTESEEHRKAIVEGQAYFANTTDTADTLTQTANGGAMLYLRNDSATSNLIIEKVLTSSNGAGGVVKWIKNPTLGTIGSNNTHTPVNTNFSAGAAADVTCFNWNETGDGMQGLSAGTILKTFITNAGFTIHPIDGAVILGKGDAMQVNYNASGASTPEFEAGIRFYFDELEG